MQKKLLLLCVVFVGAIFLLKEEDHCSNCLHLDGTVCHDHHSHLALTTKLKPVTEVALKEVRVMDTKEVKVVKETEEQILHPVYDQLEKIKKEETWVKRRRLVKVNRGVMERDFFRFNPFDDVNYVVKAEVQKPLGSRGHLFKGSIVNNQGFQIGKMTMVVVNKNGQKGYAGEFIFDDGQSLVLTSNLNSQAFIEEYHPGMFPPGECRVLE